MQTIGKIKNKIKRTDEREAIQTNFGPPKKWTRTLHINTFITTFLLLNYKLYSIYYFN